MAGAAQAQNYPDKSVRVVVGFAAGGPTDVIARIVAQKLSETWGQQFYIENVPGAGSNTASGMVAKTPPDGYTLLVISTGFVVNPSLYAKVPYDPVKDFAPITLVAASPNVVLVNPSVPAKTVQELIALIRANPGKYSFAGPGDRIDAASVGRAVPASASASTWCMCRFPAPRRRSGRRSRATSDRVQRRCRRRFPPSRAASCARSP